MVVGGWMGSAQGTDLGMVTGEERGTYHQVGLNLKELARKYGISLAVLPSKGSVENVYSVYKRPGTQLGLVQADVLAFVGKMQGNAEMRKISRKIKVVFPLFTEEVHLLGRRDINGLDGLNNRRVAIGDEGSGTFLTAKLLLELAEIKPRELVPVGGEEALRQLKGGKIEAMFEVGGCPVKLFAEELSDSDALGLIPIAHKRILEFYPRAEIPAGLYGGQKHAVPTVAVRAVLVTFDYKTTSCETVGNFARVLAENLGWLSQNGHPKWRGVDLNLPVKGWEQYECVKRYLNRPLPPPARPSSEPNPVLDAIKEVL
jgi:TRAP transporter TAXI family solute receptor